MVDQKKWRPPVVDLDWSALHQTLYGGDEQTDWMIMRNVLVDVVKRFGIKEVRQRASLLWKVGDKKGEDTTFFRPRL